ncbi:hypothetical protein D3C86_1472610 [compost metagenome]
MDGIGIHGHTREARRQPVRAGPVRGHAPALQQAGIGQQKGTAAHRAIAARAGRHGANPVQHHRFGRAIARMWRTGHQHGMRTGQLRPERVILHQQIRQQPDAR